MGIFEVQADKGAFIAKGERVRRLSEQTSFYIFADSKEDAKKLSSHYIGDKIGHGSNIQSQAIFDSVAGWIDRANSNEYLEAVESVLTDAASFAGTIRIESFALISPEHEDDTLIVSLSEEGRKRTLFEKIYFKENGLIDWGDHMVAFSVDSVTMAIQRLF